MNARNNSNIADPHVCPEQQTEPNSGSPGEQRSKHGSKTGQRSKTAQGRQETRDQLTPGRNRCRGTVRATQCRATQRRAALTVGRGEI